MGGGDPRPPDRSGHPDPDLDHWTSLLAAEEGESARRYRSRARVLWWGLFGLVSAGGVLALTVMAPEVSKLGRAPRPPAVTDLKVVPELSASAAACAQGDPDRCLQVAARYEAGQGVAVRPKIALGFYLRGCEAGSPRACSRAGRLHLLAGETGVALELLARGCEGGDAWGCDQLSRNRGRRE